MQTRPAEEARATAGTAMAQSQDHQTGLYPNSNPASSRKLLEQAAEVLLLLEFPLPDLERVAFNGLFERRLCRVYEGVPQ